MMISKIPSGKFSSVADHRHCDTEAPGTRGGSADVNVRQDTEFWLMEGALPLPEKLKEIALVTEGQSMSVLNSRVMSTVVAFASPLSA